MSKNVLALGLGLAIVAATLWLVDRGVKRLAGMPDVELSFLASPHVHHPAPGYAQPAGSSFPHRKQVGDEVLYDVVYHVDEYHRRSPETPQPDGRARRPALFFGGSFIFGEGLDYADTTPAQFEALRPEYRAYNYGFRGYGPQQMLAKLEAGFEPGEIEPRGSAVAFYSYYDFHHARANGFLSFVRFAGGKHPYYRLDERGEVVRDGIFATGRPLTTRLYWLLSKSAILTLFGVELPPELRPEHYALSCGILRRSRELFLEEFAGGRFVVAVGPISGLDDPFVTTCLEAEAFEIVDARVPAEEVPKLVFSRDRHPNSAGARLLAEALAERY